jgi:hypothetical protein
LDKIHEDGKNTQQKIKSWYSRDFVNTKIGVLTALKFLLINTYVEALKSNFNNTINIANTALNFYKKRKPKVNRKTSEIL